MARDVRPAVCAIVLGLGAVGCATRVEPGLANAPSIQRANRPRDSYDVVANGHGSCPPPEARDPLPNRIPACAEERSDAGQRGEGSTR